MEEYINTVFSSPIKRVTLTILKVNRSVQLLDKNNLYFAITCRCSIVTLLHVSLVYYQATKNVIVLVVIAPASATGARARQKVTPPKKTIQEGTALAPQDGGVAASACRRVLEKKTQERTWQYKQLAHKQLIQDATAQPLTSLTNLEEEERANLKKRTAKKRSSTTLQETQNLQNMHASTKSRKRELRPESSNSSYRIESWLTQLPQNNEQNQWLVTSRDPPNGQGPGQTASRSRQPIWTHSIEEI